MNKKLLFFMLLIFGLRVLAQKSLVDYVDPMIGTKNMGHVYPGATVPFGMVQLSPETDVVWYAINGEYNKNVYRYCAGYQYEDKTIVGFSHTHFSGTGHSDLGDFLIMPTTGEIQLDPGTAENPDLGYRSRFTHASEKARPGYYAVNLDDYGIHAELTATARVGFHRYRFPQTDQANIVLDMEAGLYNYDGKVIWSSIRVENDTLITGYRQTRGWARNRTIYFAMQFSQAIENYGFRNREDLVYKGFYCKFNETRDFPEMAGRKMQAYFRFHMEKDNPLLVKVALSPVSTLGAIGNLQAELPHWNFDKVQKEAQELWEKELGKIIVNGSNRQKVIFYTALYHTFLAPTLYMDADHMYRGIDQNNYQADGFVNYSTFSLWDTFRALHPLFTIIQTGRTNDMIQSMLAHAAQSVHKILPVWSHQANENWCMIGYHAVPVIVDAFMKGIRGYDVQKAWQACFASATYGPYDGLFDYMKLGYVPNDRNSDSASKTLEYAYDDWILSKMAQELGYHDQARKFKARAQNFEHIFDVKTGFMRAKNADGSWLTPFDPLTTEGQGFIEGNAWNYSLFVPQDIGRLIQLHGGNKRFVRYLDKLFTMELPEEFYAHSEDINRVGIIGNYIHGNEPSHHVPYLYVYAGKPEKTQARVRIIVDNMYKETPDGMCGNDDCGQMSAWYVFSVLGFYPVCPGSGEYAIGTPCVPEARMILENGKVFTIKAPDVSERNIYIQGMKLNGKKLERYFLRHADIMNGGELVFSMAASPVKH